VRPENPLEELQVCLTDLLSSIHFAFSSLGIRSGNLSLADDHLVLANEAIEKFGKGRNIQLNGMYNYIAGRVRLDQGRIPESM
jgi:hypothetical protein